MSVSPTWGSGLRRRSPQNVQLWRPVGFDCRNSTGLGETETPLWEGAYKVSWTPGTRGKSSDHIEACQTYLLVLEGFLQRWGDGCGSLWGQRHWWEYFWGVLIGMSPLGGCHFVTKTWPYPRASRLQCWDASGQTTNRVRTQPHQSADRLHKVFLIPQLPTKHTHWHGPAHQRDKTRLHPPV